MRRIGGCMDSDYCVVARSSGASGEPAAGAEMGRAALASGDGGRAPGAPLTGAARPPPPPPICYQPPSG